MKRTVSFVLAVILVFSLGIVAFADSYKVSDTFSVKFGDDYTVLDRSSLKKNKTAVTDIGYTVDTLKKYMTENDIYLMAIDEKGNLSFVIKQKTSDFTSKVGSFNSFDSASLEEINQELFGGNGTPCEVDGLTYIRTKSHTESSSDYTFQYVTVQNGIMYSVISYSSSSAAIEELMKDVSIKTSSGSTGFTDICVTVLIVIVVVAAIVGMVLIGISVVRDIRNKKTDTEDEQKDLIQIKRRKIKK